MLRIVYGPVGCGKSTSIYNEIAQDLKNGRKPILIVPDQYVLTAENAVADMVEGELALDLEVLSFRRLANHVFRTLGGLSFNDLDDGGRLLIMWRVLRECSPFLKTYFGVDEKNTSFAELMLTTVNELKQFNVTPSMLDVAGRKLNDTDKNLSDKLYDISFIYGAYQAFLSKEYNDPSDELTRLAETLKDSGFFNGYKVYFDAFDGFTPQQYSVIKEIIDEAEESVFSLCYDPEDKTGVFATTERTYKTLRKLADRRGLPVSENFIRENHSFKHSDIAYVSKNLWRHDIPAESFSGDSSHVNTVSCHDKFEECEAVVCDILKKVRSGVRYKDILIISRDIGSYEGIIDAELESNGIPYFMSKRTDITTKPIFKLILAALAIKNKNWQYNDVISYVKTGLAGLSYDECDVLENYASSWNIKGKRWYDGIDWNMNPDGFAEVVSENGKLILTKVNEIREKIVPPLVKLFDCFGKTTVTDISRAFYDYLVELNIKEKTECAAAECRRNEDFEGEKEYVQLWNLLISAFDTLVEYCGDMAVDSEEYALLLGIILGKTDIGTIPASIDQVLLGSASMLRSGSVDHVYLLGVNEGTFPKNVDENCIFSDREKSVLRSLDVEISPDSDEQTANELYWFYKSVSSAVESLTLTYSSSDLKGASNKLSVAGARVNYLLNNKEEIVYSELPAIDRLEGKSIAMKLMALHRGEEFGEAVKQYFEGDEKLKNAVEAFDIPLEAGISDIDEGVAADIYKGDMSTSQSRIDSYVKCSFDYHCKYILKLQEKKETVFRSNDIGNFVHVVLERFMSRIATEKGIDTDITNDEVERLIDEIITDYIRSVFYGISENSPRILQLIKRLKRTSILLIKNILAEFRQSEFIPRFFEMPITKEAEEGVEPYEIELNDGTKLYMRGIADRVDTYKKGKDVYIRIVDYKTGTKTFSPDDIEKGLNLQMLLYLFAVWNTKRKDFREKINCEGEIIPAGILYFAAKAPDFFIESEDEIGEAYNTAENSIGRIGMLLNDEEILRAMDKNLEQKYIPIKLYKNGNFSNTKYLKTVEEFGKLSEEIDGILRKIASDMKSGVVRAEPMETKNEMDSPCVYCKMKPVCRRLSKGDENE